MGGTAAAFDVWGSGHSRDTRCIERTTKVGLYE